MFQLFYRKVKNSDLITKMESILGLSNVHNYNPIFNRFFSLNHNNWNRIQFNTVWELKDINPTTERVFPCTLSKENKEKNKNVFFKFSPLLDPLKYVVGKYQDSDLAIPEFEKQAYFKTQDVNNSGYVDGFFCYLSSQLLHNYGFLHGVDFYGSFNALKSDFKFNVEDDLEYVQDSDFFHRNINKLFKLSEEFSAVTSRKFKPSIIIQHDVLIDIETIVDNSVDTCVDKSVDTCVDKSVDTCVDESVDTCVDKSVDTCVDESVDESDDTKSSNTGSDKSTEDDDWSDDSNYEEPMITINSFPVHVICVEGCHDTIDNIMIQDIHHEEVASALMQIIMTLITYQKVFDFTHNDLHTNNIMFVKTEEEFVYYCYESVYYKVPTFGKLYKIIDFGRAVYRYKSNRFVSDSFHKDGDAATQYNIEPYLDSKKNGIEPNHSFDLCRLACSMLDLLPEQDCDLKKLIEEWCLDDKDRNVLYKKNREERYPNFKLYKMIARTVHKHTPTNQLKKEIFKQYAILQTLVQTPLMNIDAIPVMV